MLRLNVLNSKNLKKTKGLLVKETSLIVNVFEFSYYCDIGRGGEVVCVSNCRCGIG